MARCGCTGDTATTIVVTEDSECIGHSGDGTLSSPLSAYPIISPGTENLVECLTGGLFVSNRGVFTPQDFGPTGTPDDAPVIQAALTAARDAGGGTVYVPAGVYRVASLPLRIYGRTRLTLAPGAIVRRAGSGTMLLNGDADQVMPGYSGHGDILIEGGQWDANASSFPTSAMCMSFGHATNLVIRDTWIKDVAGYHGIEVNAIKTCVISNVHGRGYLDPGGRNFSEFIQPDLAKGSAYFGGFGPYDDTPVLDLLVTGCSTGPSGTPGTIAWPRGIGSHSASPNRPHRDIRINSCRFEGCSQWAIGAYTWEAAVISDIQVRSCGGGVWVRTLNSATASHRTPAGGSSPTITGSQPLAGIVIDNITMSGGGGFGAAVELEGEDTGFLQDVAVGRIVTRGNASNGIRLSFVEDYRLHSAIAHTTGASAISTLGTRRGHIDDCHVIDTAGAGITVDSRGTSAATATDVTVSRCSVTGTAANGVHVWAGVDIVIDDCELYALTGYGVQVSTNTDRITVRDTRTRATSLAPINFTSTVTNAVRTGNSSDAPGSTTTATAANSAAETVVASWLIPAGDALPGTAYRFAAHGQASTTATPTLTIRVRLGGVTGTVVAAFAAVTTGSAIANRGWEVNGVLHAIAPGSSGTWSGGAQLWHRLASTTGAAAQEVTDGVITRDSTADQALVVTAQWSAASASNTAQALAATLLRI
ncbi:right-handed parallel beta-helix repeat-containing protein [Streptomyces sp. NBC_00120]|uniref:right-handed parallel beta-helix repeat-containing protein n=1 Tax=Streptomyces sp. NBC_00120 TaxID=2975660 RepID=UPI00225A1D34|nr:right-handed parallel beta-helix repeat-containing protein [Streptomyces sp. NBC_00120]MCX5326268.1 right-handed parallel beta-helix repeat-containing protein [Streptomyces sp. NBC_00120]